MAVAITSADIVVTRLLPAVPNLVFQAFTDPAHIAKWWGPRGFTTTTRSMDLRAGGRWVYVMHGPDGTDYDNLVEYLEVDAPNRIVYRNSNGMHEDENAFTASISFTAAEGGTRVEFRMHFKSAEARDAIADAGAYQGALETLDRFEEHLAPGSGRYEIVISRSFKAPQPLVWAAYTKPDHLKQWWSPGDWTLPVSEVDLRVGGAWLYCMKGPDGTEAWGKATYEAIEEPDRLAYIDTFVDAAGHLLPNLPQTPVVIEFSTVEDRTVVTFRATYATASEAEEMITMGMLEGMRMCLDKLEEHLGAA